MPLAAWLKDFFRKHKQMGARDRRTVAEMVYGYYRLGHLPFSDMREKILAGIRVGNTLTDMIGYFGLADNPDYDKYAQSTEADLATGLPDGQRHALFPWKDKLSEGVDADAFEASFLHKPELFLRIRPGHEQAVREKLDLAGIMYRVEGACISLSPATKLEGLLEIDREVVIQDKSSQQTGSFLREIPFAVSSWWDCCAGSGGKSIMAYDLLQVPAGAQQITTGAETNTNITVSDNRKTILHNLGDRFAAAGIANYRSFRIDLTDPSSPLPSEQFDLIIADVPCSGSGTWARTPEQLYYFKPEKLDHYVSLQEKILTRAVQRLKPGGAILYLTCSVFARENEAMVRYLEQQPGLQLLRSAIIPGYLHKADTMFGALLCKKTG